MCTVQCNAGSSSTDIPAFLAHTPPSLNPHKMPNDERMYEEGAVAELESSSKLTYSKIARKY
jgi:hypothetical protein